ncbi:lactate utilization protein [Granulosicoccaceae sp. 1_MG-2023]|nr:lactate utilization protein [Granulosicoccaceae sp. 1_MG-2023]
MSSREAILGNIRQNLQARLQQREAAPRPAGPVPLPSLGEDLQAALLARMDAVQMSYERLAGEQDVVGAVQAFIAARGDDATACQIDISPQLQALDWSALSGAAFGPARAGSRYGVTRCLAAVAETGSIVMASGPEHAVTQTFLPDCHIVVLRADQVVDRPESVWPLVRSLPALPRAVNFNTGPSRTGDIEQTIEIGAHGPRVMHVLIVE